MKPNKKYDHVYAILRHDDFLGDDIPCDHKVTVKKIVTDEAEAKAEVDRLNKLAVEGVGYYLQMTRIKKLPPSS